MTETVVVLGASPKPQRYSYKAVQLLREYQHRVLPVNPYHSEVAGQACVAGLADVAEAVDTVTLYLRPELLAPHIEEIIALKPRRVIFNPGTESTALAQRLQQRGIETEEACTLVMLRNDQF